MNIEECIEQLKDLRLHCLSIGYEFDKDAEAIEYILTAYEKEIEDNKKYIDLHYVPYEQYTSKLNELNKKWEDKIRLKMKQEMDKGYRLSEERHLQNYAYDRLKELLEE